MKSMYLDTSSSTLYVGFYEDEHKLFEVVAPGKNNHSENLIKNIEEGLNKCKLEISDFDAIVVGIGPGSYTGLRVSLTVAKTFSWTNKIPLFTASSLDILASNYLNKEGIYAITNKAKKDYLYAKLIKVDEEGNKEDIIKDSFILETEFLKLIEAYDYILIDESKFSINPVNLTLEHVDEVHTLSPNYLQKEI